jgi:hypothetical protein
MTSGITSAGVDLDNIFSPKGTATAPATGITIGTPGVDLNQRYLALSQGVAVPATGIKVNNADLNTYFGRVGALVIPFGSYAASSADTHDAGAGLTLTMNTDGTWSISMYALHGGSTSGTPLSGTWVSNPGAGIGNSYEMLLDSSHMGISNGYTPPDQVSPFFTASTGWVSLSTARTVQADTSHLIAGGAGSGLVTVSGYFLIYIRPNGSGSGVQSTLQVNVEADAL